MKMVIGTDMLNRSTAKPLTSRTAQHSLRPATGAPREDHIVTVNAVRSEPPTQKIVKGTVCPGLIHNWVGLMVHSSASVFSVNCRVTF